MKLYGSINSPYVRKIRILIGELGLSDRVETVWAEGSPLDAPGARVKNPLRKIPFLETADGAVVYDSRTVAEALIEAAGGERMLPARGPARLEALTRQALSDGLCDSALLVSYEKRLRPAELQWKEWLDTQMAKVASALDAMEASPPPEGRFDLGDCGWVAAMVYLDLRFGDWPWRDSRPRIAAWFAAAQKRPSVIAAA